MLKSISRLRNDICTKDQVGAGRVILSRMAAYNRVEDMINIGAYAPGSNPDIDKAIESLPRIKEFLRQDITQQSPLEDSFAKLAFLAAQ